MTITLQSKEIDHSSREFSQNLLPTLLKKIIISMDYNCKMMKSICIWLGCDVQARSCNMTIDHKYQKAYDQALASNKNRIYYSSLKIITALVFIALQQYENIRLWISLYIANAIFQIIHGFLFNRFANNPEIYCGLALNMGFHRPKIDQMGKQNYEVMMRLFVDIQPVIQPPNQDETERQKIIRQLSIRIELEIEELNKHLKRIGVFQYAFSQFVQIYGLKLLINGFEETILNIFMPTILYLGAYQHFENNLYYFLSLFYYPYCFFRRWLFWMGQKARAYFWSVQSTTIVFRVGQARQECNICLQAFVQGECLLALGCSPSHHFHKTCMEQWIKNSRSCPLCRASIR